MVSILPSLRNFATEGLRFTVAVKESSVGEFRLSALVRPVSWFSLSVIIKIFTVEISFCHAQLFLAAATTLYFGCFFTSFV